jgi:Nif-specific regulatory protein
MRTLDDPRLIGRSKLMASVDRLVSQVAAGATTVLIRGESGTGKELVARTVHARSGRASGPFIAVNCAALPESVVESELFGHERGAFTGAIQQRAGRFERAHHGTLFLDEIGDLPPLIQVKLLRVLQERQIERVGGNRPVHVDVRVIAATHQPLEAMVAAGTFREDLYYRLNVFPIHLPPLRDRGSDILMLADFFVERLGRAHNKEIRRISTPAIDALMGYHWPGNVRELENVIERAVLVSADHVIHSYHLPPTLQTAEASDTRASGTLQSMLDAYERELLMEALKSHRGNCAAAARMLGISERIMGLRVRKYDLDWRRFRRLDGAPEEDGEGAAEERSDPTGM